MKKQLWLPAAVLVMLLAGCGAQGAEPADAAPVTEATTAAGSTQAVTACTTQTTTETTATATETSATQTTTTEPVRQKITLKTAGAVEVYDTVLLRDYITEPEIRLENKNSRLDTSKTGTVEQSVRFTYQGQSYTQNIRYQVVDTTPPLLLNGGYNTVIETGKPFDLNKCVGFGDNYDKSPRLTYTGQVDTAVPGKYPITATVTDAAGNKTSWDLTVTVADKLPTYTDTASRLSFSDFAEAYGGKNKRLGIDVSKWQGKINFEAVRDAGCQFVIMRIGHGRNGMEMDEYYRSNMAGAKSAGLDVVSPDSERSPLGWAESLTVQLHGPGQGPEPRLRAAGDPHQVLLFHLVPGMNEGVGQISVIGEQQQPLGVQVQPAHRPDPGRAPIHQVGNCAPALLIREGRHHPPGFVEHQDRPGLAAHHRLAVQGDLIPVRVRPVPQGSRPAVYGDPAGGYVFLRPAAGADPRRGEELLQAILHA